MTASLHGQSIDFGPMYEEYSIVYQGAVYYRETQESGTLSTISDVGMSHPSISPGNVECHCQA